MTSIALTRSLGSLRSGELDGARLRRALKDVSPIDRAWAMRPGGTSCRERRRSRIDRPPGAPAEPLPPGPPARTGATILKVRWSP